MEHSCFWGALIRVRRPAPRRSAGYSHVNRRVRREIPARSRSHGTTDTGAEPSLSQVLEDLAVLRGKVMLLRARAPLRPVFDGNFRPGSSGVLPSGQLTRVRPLISSLDFGSSILKMVS